MTKISSLSDIGTGVASNDTFVLVDASDPTTPNKKIQQQNLFLIPDGSAGTPGLRFLNDLDTGIYRPGANQVAISTNGTGRLFIDSSGNVGIGTTSPGQLLDLSAGTNLNLGIDQLAHDSFTNEGIGLTFTRTNSDSDLMAVGVVDTDRLGIFSREGIIFGTGGTTLYSSTTEKARIDSSGNVGIGTSNPTGKLHVRGATDTTIAIDNEDDSTAKIDFKNTGSINMNIAVTNTNMIFSDNNNERMRIDSAGRLLVGTSSSKGPDNFLQLVGDVNDEASITCWRSSDGTGSGGINFIKTRGSVSSPTVASNNDSLGIIRWHAYDGSTWDGRAAQIEAQVDGTPGASDMPGRLVFSSTPSGSASPTEQLRITSDRYVRLASGTGGIQFNGDTAAANALDDYEEGTFTPTIVGTTAAGTGTYTIQTGVYTKVGNVVHYAITVLWTAHTGTGNMRIDGLPFTARNLGNYNPSVTLDVNNLASPASTIVTGTILSNTTLIGLNSVPVAGGSRASLALDTAGTIWASGSYTV